MRSSRSTPRKHGVFLLAFLASFAALPQALAEEPEQGPTATPVGLLQVWGTGWDQDLDPQADPPSYGDPEDDMGFKIRRARIGVEGEVGRGIEYEVVFGAASSYDAWDPAPEEIGLVDANLGWKGKGFEVIAGQQKVPFSREQLMSVGEVVFTERSVASEHMSPGREIGLLAGWKNKNFQVRAGAFNGNANYQGDDNTGMLWAGRLEYGVGKAEDRYTTFGKVEKPVFAFGANGYYNQDLATDTLMYGGDLLVRVQGLAVLLEGAMGTIKPADSDAATPDILLETPRKGLTGQVGYSVKGIEPAVRVSLFDDNANADVKDNGDVMEIMGGASWHTARDRAKFGLGYVHRTELAGRVLPNDTLRLWGQVRY